MTDLFNAFFSGADKQGNHGSAKDNIGVKELLEVASTNNDRASQSRAKGFAGGFREWGASTLLFFRGFVDYSNWKVK